MSTLTQIANEDSSIEKPKEFDIAEYNPSGLGEREHAEAQKIVNEKISKGAEDFISVSKEQRLKREQYDGSVSKDPVSALESAVNRMNARLTQNLRESVEAEKEKIYEGRSTFLRKLLQKLHVYNPKPVSDQEALNNVIKAQIRGIESYTEQLGVDYKRMEEEYSRRRQTVNSLTKDANKSIDVYTQGEKVFESLQQQLTENLRARDEYMKKRAQPGYNGEVDDLIKSCHNTISHLEEKIEDVKDELQLAASDIEYFENQLAVEKSFADESKAHKLVFQNELKDSRITRDTLVRIMDNEGGRRSLIESYKSIIEGRKKGEIASVIIEEGKKLIEEAMTQVGKNNYNKMFKTGSSYSNLLKDIEARQAEYIQSAKARRMGIDASQL
jgi:flagellar biosynthesis chaperone FliJ